MIHKFELHRQLHGSDCDDDVFHVRSFVQLNAPVPEPSSSPEDSLLKIFDDFTDDPKLDLPMLQPWNSATVPFCLSERSVEN